MILIQLCYKDVAQMVEQLSSDPGSIPDPAVNVSICP